MKNITSKAAKKAAAISAKTNDDTAEVMENSANLNANGRFKNLSEILNYWKLGDQNVDLMDLKINYSNVLDEIEIKFSLDFCEAPAEVFHLVFKRTESKYLRMTHFKVELVRGDSDEVWKVFDSIDKKGGASCNLKL